MKVNEIIKEINDCGGFDNFRNWNTKDISEWIYNNFECSRYIAKQAAYKLI